MIDPQPKVVRYLLAAIFVVTAAMALCLPWVECPACTVPGEPPAPTILDKGLARLQTFQRSLRRAEAPSPEDVMVCIRTLKFTPVRWVLICPRCNGEGRLSLLKLKK